MIIADGTPQSFYFPEGHEAAGCFKGMKAILEERGFQVWRPNPRSWTRVSHFVAPDRTDCRYGIRRTLYSQLDFWAMTSSLEEQWEAWFRDVVPPRVPLGAWFY